MIYIMDEDFDFFSTDINNWNYNEFKNKTVVDPYNNKKSWTRSVII
jgi:hypothetical protein